MMPVWFALGSLSLGFPSAVLRVLVPLKCTWIPFLLQFLELFTCIGYVRDYNGGLVFSADCWIVVVGCIGSVVGLLVGLGELEIPLVEGPKGELAVLEGCFDVFMVHISFFFFMVSTHLYPKYPPALSTTSPAPAPPW